MRGLVLVLSALITVGIALLPLQAPRSQPDGARASSTGAPTVPGFTEQTCATADCHDDNGVNTGPGTLTIEDVPTEYVPGQPIEFIVRIDEPDRSVFGFQVAVKALSDVQTFYEHAGALELVDPTHTKFALNDDYVTHTLNGLTQNAWTVRWVPPAADVGEVTIYAAGNAANGDEQATGDHIYTTSHAMTAATTTAVDDEATPGAFTLEPAFPNPFSNQTSLRYTLYHTAPVTLTLYDIRGRRVRHRILGTQPAGTHTAEVEAGTLPAGLYFYELSTPDARVSRPVTLVK